MDNLNKRTVKWSLFIALLFLAYGFGVLLMCERRIPYERPPARTESEQRWIDKAINEDKIGRHTIIEGVNEIIIRMEDGRTRTTKRG